MRSLKSQRWGRSIVLPSPSFELRRLMVLAGQHHATAALTLGKNAFTYFTRNWVYTKAGLVAT